MEHSPRNWLLKGGFFDMTAGVGVAAAGASPVDGGRGREMGGCGRECYCSKACATACPYR